MFDWATQFIMLNIITSIQINHVPQLVGNGIINSPLTKKKKVWIMASEK